MNDYLVTYDGGQDVWADDLSFMQDSLKSMIDTAIRTYGDNCILWGCLDSGNTNVVEGGVVISGKLYQVPALGAIGSNKLCFREVLSDERTFENQQVHKVKKQYEAYLSTDTSGAVAWIDLISAATVWKDIQVVGEGLSGTVRYRIEEKKEIAILDIQIVADGQYGNGTGKYMFAWPSELDDYNSIVSTCVFSGTSMNYISDPVAVYKGNVYDASGPRDMRMGEGISGTFILTKKQSNMNATELKKRAIALAEKTKIDSVTPEEVGQLSNDIVEYIENVELNGSTLGIRKTYTSVSAMESDSTAPKDDKGVLLRRGMLVNIYNQEEPDSADNGKVFSFQNPGWAFRGTVDAGYATREELTELEKEIGNVGDCLDKINSEKL